MLFPSAFCPRSSREPWPYGSLTSALAGNGATLQTCLNLILKPVEGLFNAIWKGSSTASAERGLFTPQRVEGAFGL